MLLILIVLPLLPVIVSLIKLNRRALPSSSANSRRGSCGSATRADCNTTLKLRMPHKAQMRATRTALRNTKVEMRNCKRYFPKSAAKYILCLQIAARRLRSDSRLKLIFSTSRRKPTGCTAIVALFCQIFEWTKCTGGKEITISL